MAIYAAKGRNFTNQGNLKYTPNRAINRPTCFVVNVHEEDCVQYYPDRFILYFPTISGLIFYSEGYIFFIIS